MSSAMIRTTLGRAAAAVVSQIAAVVSNSKAKIWRMMCCRMVCFESCCEVQVFLHAGLSKLYFASALLICWNSVVEFDTGVGTRQVGGIRFVLVSDGFAMVAEKIDA